MFYKHKDYPQFRVLFDSWNDNKEITFEIWRDSVVVADGMFLNRR